MSTRQIFSATLTVLLTAVAAYLVYRLLGLVVLLFVSILVASALRPAMEWLAARGIRRSAAALIVVTLALLAAAALIAASVPPLVRLAIEHVTRESAWELGTNLRNRLTAMGLPDTFQPPILRLPAQLVGLAESLREAAEVDLGRYTYSAILFASQLVLALVIGYYWLTSRDDFLDLLLSMSPAKHRPRVELIWNDIEATLAGWLQAQVILSVTIGLAAYVGLAALRVPEAFILAVIAGLTEMIPMVGQVLGAVPAVLVGLDVSFNTGLLVALWFFIIQVVEGNILVPKVMERRIGLHPLVVISALIAGATLNGAAGSLLAVPIAGALQVIARHLVIDPAITRSSRRVMEDGGVLFEPDGDQDAPAPPEPQ